MFLLFILLVVVPAVAACLGRWNWKRVALALLCVQIVGLGYMAWQYSRALNDVDLMVTGMLSLAQGLGLTTSGLGWWVGRVWRRRKLK